MTRKPAVLAAIAAAALTIAFSAHAAQIGSPAPDFHGTDSNGKTQSLDQYRGKFVVLEWHNHDCPYTMKHYQSGNMQSLQKQWTAKGVVWLTIISSAPGTARLCGCRPGECLHQENERSTNGCHPRSKGRHRSSVRR